MPGMNKYKFDTHVHTSETSPCGRVTGAKLVRLYKESGYDGIVITDHYYSEYFESLGEKNWTEKTDIFLEGYRNACEEGCKIGLNVLLGMEMRFDENPNDYLVYGFGEDFLKDCKELYRLGLKAFREIALSHGLLVFQAHPFRTGISPADPVLLDGIEVFNGNPRHNSRNRLAFAFAAKHGLLMISGSDFHQVEDIGTGGIRIAQNVETSCELARILSSGMPFDILRQERPIRIPSVSVRK